MHGLNAILWWERLARSGVAKAVLSRSAIPYVQQLDNVIAAIPDAVVMRVRAQARRGRAVPAPPPPADQLGPVVRDVILAAAFTGLKSVRADRAALEGC